MIEVGQYIEDFEIENGLKLSDLKKRVIIYFYPKDLTSGCTLQAQAYRDFYEEFSKLNVAVIGVSKDSIKSHNKFIEKEGLNFPLISDEDLKLNQYFDVWKEKSMYGKKYFGTLRSSFIIDEDLKVIRVSYNVKAKEDALNNLEFLKTL